MTTAIYQRTTTIPIDELTPFPGNAKRGDVQTIRASLRRNGQYRSLVVREVEHGALVVLAGNHTMQALAAEGHTEARCEIVHCDDNTARRINLADNRSAELGTTDNDALAELLSYLDGDYEGTGYSQADVDFLLDYPEPETDAEGDAVPAPPADPVSKPGDLWLLGPHRLLCGDSTNSDDLARLTDSLTPTLVYTDPPYGISAVPKDGGTSRSMLATAQVYAPVVGDDNTEVARDAFVLLTNTYPTARQVWWGGNHYAASAALPDSSCWLVWNKENGANDFADAELAWTNHIGAVRLFTHMWHGMIRASEREKRVHPTQKTVALAEWAFSVVDPEHTREVVLDVFSGSGSTLLAAEHTERTALLMELEPAYCDVIARRYQQTTGTMPVLAATGEPHDFTSAH